MEPIFDTSKNTRRAVGQKVALIARQLRMSFDHGVAMKGLTRAKWTMIAAVSRNPGATQRVIAQALEVSEITAGRLIDRLCDEGYLQRSESPTDRRAYRLFLAAGAEPVLAQLDEVARSQEAQIFAGFAREDLQTLDKLLDLMAKNLTAAKSLRAAAK